MNTAHWHLLLNHLPVVGSIIGTLILIAGFIFKNAVVKQTALGIFIFSALCAIPAYLTGEGAEEAVENIQSVSKATIEKHEDLGKTFFILISALGALSLLTAIAKWSDYKNTSAMYILVFIVSVVTGILSKQLGTSGGQIRHTEINNTVQQQLNEPGQQDAGETSGESDDH